ncbi:Holliday junction branch migration protein RuvA [Brevibacterium samyangense]|uniref:Holliday junction branch migration complex subunit RuvA n=1 Tax=Brevibacterium samyangense TaxID=366888 RepID=A0ABN2TGY2_9MICO
MITLLHGYVHSIRPDSVTLVTQGVGRKVLVSPALALSLRHGQETELHTFLVVREDSLTLFGFGSEDERDLFEVLQTISGIGPKLALAITAVLSPAELRRAVRAEDDKAFIAVPGIGKKVAARLLLELAGKLDSLPGGDLPVAASGGTPVAEEPETGRSAAASQVVEALEGLGWKTSDAEKAVDAISGSVAEDDVSGLLRAALKHLGGRG